MTIRKPDMVGDELGDPADNPRLNEDGEYAPTRYFGYGITIPNNAGDLTAIRVRLTEFPEVSSVLGRKKVKEIKTRRLPKKYKVWLAKKLSRNARTFAFIVDKNGELPDGWADYSPSERIVAMAMYSISETVASVTSDEVAIIFDQHSALKTPWAEEFIAGYLEDLETRYGKCIYFMTAKSSAGQYSDEMQMADVVPNFVYEDIEHGRKFLRKKARIDMRFLDGRDSIRLEGLTECRARHSEVENKNRRGAVFPPKRDVIVIVEVL